MLKVKKHRKIVLVFTQMIMPGARMFHKKYGLQGVL
jgi:hypothetical protein